MDKDAPASSLAESIRRVARGQEVLDPRLAIGARETEGHPLTRRELEVLRRAAEGESVREVAAHLCLSVGTVCNYLTKIIGSSARATASTPSASSATPAGSSRAPSAPRPPHSR